MTSRRRSSLTFWAVQLLLVGALAIAYEAMGEQTRDRFRVVFSPTGAFKDVPIPRAKPLRIDPLYDDHSIVTDKQLADVLRQVRPILDPKELRPNYVEHALRTWGVDATFADPQALSGEAMRDFLTHDENFHQSWGDAVEPLLTDGPKGVVVRWGRERGASVHHDHLLACLTEAGVSLTDPVSTRTSRNKTIADMLRQALFDFRYDERETEWSVAAFTLWLPPNRRWKAPDGRHLSFDMLAERLMRGHLQKGVCAGTHRVFSLLVLLRVDDQYDILSDETRERVFRHLQHVRDLLVASQCEDGHWPYNWPDGEEAAKNPKDDPPYRAVIATGHHLEWLALAPKELHPPHDRIVRAAKWVIQKTVSKSPDEIRENYTFYSHVGAALALWRGTHPAEFWSRWLATHN
ncbi:MAG: hypothetical protein GXP27_19240 [Planctomycetes bacterium]|nr:hypothetical protein [Planctomycetota bacterium]